MTRSVGTRRTAGRLALLLSLLLASPAQADDARGKRLFDEGLVAIAEAQYALASRLFEASLADADRPATRYNLVLANLELLRPLEVARHALAFLAMPEAADRAAARMRVEEALREARAQLAILTTDRPAELAELRIDGAPPGLHVADSIYLLPGWHSLERAGGGPAEQRLLLAGTVTRWPERDPTPLALSVAEAPRVVAQDTPPAPAPPPAWRRPLALSATGLGAVLELSAVASFAVAEYRARRLHAHDPEADGFVPLADSYWQARRSIPGLAVAGGILLSGAVVLGQHDANKATWPVVALSTAGALLGAGGILLIRSPDALVANTDVSVPSRELGTLLVSLSLPLLTFGMRYLIAGRHAERASLHRAQLQELSW